MVTTTIAGGTLLASSFAPNPGIPFQPISTALAADSSGFLTQGQLYQRASAIVAASASLGSVGYKLKEYITTSLAADSSLVPNSGIAFQPISTVLAANSSLTAIPQPQLLTAVLAASASLASNPIIFQFITTVLTASSSLTANPPLYLVAAAILNASVVASYDLKFGTVLHQSDFRWRTDTNSVDGAPTWAEPEDISSGFNPGVSTFRLRVKIRNTSSIDFSGPYQLYVSKNGGPTSLVTITSIAGVQSADASSDPDETPIYVPRL